MPEPKKKTSKHKTRIREFTRRKKKIALVKCAKCDTLIRPHTVCQVCGTYKGRKYIDVEKREKRAKDKLKREERREEENSK